MIKIKVPNFLNTFPKIYQLGNFSIDSFFTILIVLYHSNPLGLKNYDAEKLKSIQLFKVDKKICEADCSSTSFKERLRY